MTRRLKSGGLRNTQITPQNSPHGCLKIYKTAKYIRELRRVIKRGKDTTLLDEIIGMLANRQSLPPRRDDHALIGNWRGYRECKIQPDWLLIYRVVGEILELYRTGTHSDLF